MLVYAHRVKEEAGPILYDKGDWTALKTQEDIVFPGHKTTNVNLGVVIYVPKGFEIDAKITDGMSQKYGFTQPCGEQTISSGYDKEMEIMLFNPRYPVKIKKGTTVCRFRITPTQQATWRQKLKWIFNGIPHYKYV